MLGWELLRVQGFPMGMLQRQTDEGKSACSDAQCADLAGNAFSSTVVVPLMLAIHVYMPEMTELLSQGSEEASAESEQEGDLQGLADLFTGTADKWD